MFQKKKKIKWRKMAGGLLGRKTINWACVLKFKSIFDLRGLQPIFPFVYPIKYQLQPKKGIES